MPRPWNLARKRRPHAARRPPVRPRLVQLEDRTVLTVYTPAQVAVAYGFNQINFGTSSSPIPGDGRGQTIAVVDAYADPHIGSDLAAFSMRYGLPQMNSGGPSFMILDQSNGTPDPTGGRWEMETALDVEWAHAVAPQANILLVQAANDYLDPTSGSPTALLSGVNAAASAGGVVAVSMSWGVSEYANQVSDEAAFAPSAHPGVTFVAAAGDTGAGVNFPAASPSVLSVGGTSLTADSWGNWQSETGWAGSGGGRSRYEGQPSYQAAVVPAAMSTPPGGSTPSRTTPDVAYDADPDTGVVVYNNGSYYAVGGTSAGAPQWAALVAIANQGAALQGNGPLSGATQTLPALYAASQSDFHDITSGSNGNSATVGYDLVTGRGTPRAQLIVNDLVRASTPGGGTGGGGGGGSLGGGTGSSSPTFTQNSLGSGGTHSLPRPPVGSLEQTGLVFGPAAPQPTGLTVLMPVTTMPSGAGSTTAAAPIVILPPPAAFTATAVLPTAATVTAFTAAPATAVTPAVTGLAALTTFTTSAASNSGGSGGDTLLGPALAQPAVPADGNPGAPAQDNNPAPMPPAPDNGAPEAPGATSGLPGVVPAEDDATGGGAALGWEGESVTVPNSGAVVAALLLALGYCGKGQAVRLHEEERRRGWLGG
jgi:hypothetical protein